MHRSLLLLIMLIYSSGDALSQNSLSLYSATHYGFIFPHSQEVQNTTGARPFGIEAGVMYTDTSDAVYNTCNCFTGQGMNVTYFDFDRDFLGRSFGVNYFFEPAFRIDGRLQFKIRGTLGAIYLTNPYDPVSNPSNQSYSTHASFFLGLSSGLSYQISPTWQASLYANYLHTSNGGFKDPNKGINWPTAQLQFNHFPGSFRVPDAKNRITHQEFRSGITVYGIFASRLLQHGDKVRYSVFGLTAEAYRQFTNISGWIAGAELYEDISLKKRMEKEDIYGISSVRSGLTAGHVFLLGRIQFSQQLGYYLYSPNPFFGGFYHRWGLNYAKNDRWVFGASLKAHRHVANFVDVRVGYRWSRKIEK
ncbi:MAG: acyloxyacyl hydrolase [Saprospiraceae bacterium]|nr:acyloxyacyl hydrolase [Saprospiraceae bacterium]